MPKKRSLASALLLAFILAISSETVRADDPRETPLVRAVKRACPAVVNIHSEKTTYSDDTAYSASGKRRGKVNGMGTGIVIDERGYIVTNHHVVNRVDSLRVTLENGSTYSAVVISEDPVRDLAILKIQPRTPLTVMPFGTSSDLMLGETVFAVGNAFGYENTVTVGIVSSLSRDVEVNDTQSYKNLIQTDAAINPGNSGGPLVNLRGEVIGINVAIRANAQKIGFAIPIDDARKVIADLLKIEYFDNTYHGLITRDLKTATSKQLIIEGSRPGSPAEKAGLKLGDVILKAGTVDVSDGADLERACLGHNAGDEIHLSVRHSGKSEEVSLKLSAVPNNVLAAGNGSVIIHAENDPLSRRIWEEIGVRVQKIAKTSPNLANLRYDGGLQVISVRAGSPAYQGYIQSSDVLVGLEKWATLKPEDILWVLNHHQTTPSEPLQFHVVRSNETLKMTVLITHQH